MYQSKEPCFISKELSLELSLLRQILEQPSTYKWECPIVHLVPRSPDYTSTGDASLFAGGGYSLDLKFWWYIHWPEEIQSKTLKFFTINKKRFLYWGTYIHQSPGVCSSHHKLCCGITCTLLTSFFCNKSFPSHPQLG